MKKIFLIVLLLVCVAPLSAQYADKKTYLSDFKVELMKKWPKNRTLNIVFHGHSVPSGYAKTPLVATLDAYPHQVMHGLKLRYVHAVLNVITTAIGGEQSEQGMKRFKEDVLTHKPDVLLIDYALNDRGIGLERSEKAWRKMIEEALKKGIKVILLTPTPDQTVDILDRTSALEKHAEMIRKLAAEYHTGLVDSYAIFREKVENGEDIKNYMSQVNHPNSAGHLCVASEILTWFY